MTKHQIEIANQVEEEHKGINQDIGEIKLAVMQEVSPEDFANWRLEFIWQLRDFKNRLLRHFDLEEEGGFMKDVLSAAPESQPKVRELKAEHRQFSKSLEKIIDTLKAMHKKDSEKLEQTRIDLNEILATLQKHEEEEHRLLQRTYFREYGGPS